MAPKRKASDASSRRVSKRARCSEGKAAEEQRQDNYSLSSVADEQLADTIMDVLRARKPGSSC